MDDEADESVGRSCKDFPMADECRRLRHKNLHAWHTRRLFSMIQGESPDVVLTPAVKSCYRRCERDKQRYDQIPIAKLVRFRIPSYGSTDICPCRCDERNGKWFPKWGHRNGKLGGGSQRYADYLKWGEPHYLDMGGVRGPCRNKYAPCVKME